MQGGTGGEVPGAGARPPLGWCEVSGESSTFPEKCLPAVQARLMKAATGMNLSLHCHQHAAICCTACCCSLNNIGRALAKQGRLADAEATYKQVRRCRATFAQVVGFRIAFMRMCRCTSRSVGVRVRLGAYLFLLSYKG